ncbi:DUF3800 domain-containing protein [Acrocarpospora sp. B8E8]|uniref:DUF3800 domain-containing protein n=1 Tax=Acrocarpospora sp. B8E8 TaxID=3153572 RepID=UPI00325C3C03
MTTAPVRLFYIDDSGAESTGFIVYSWIECAIEDWRLILRGWLDLRKELYAQYGIPPAYELHATKFIRGIGNPSTNLGWNRRKQNRSIVMREALAAIGSTPALKTGTAYRRTSMRGGAYQVERDQVYEVLVANLDARVGAAGEFGMIFMDGDGTATGYYNAHRALKLAHRNIIEDPLFVPAHRSAWVQMADLVAWTAYQSLLCHPGKRFAWQWYDEYLLTCDVNSGPLAL